MNRSSTSGLLARSEVSLAAVDRLEQSVALLRRVAEIEGVYRGLLRSSVGAFQVERAVCLFRDSLERACQNYLEGRPQAARTFIRLGDVRAASTPTRPPI